MLGVIFGVAAVIAMVSIGEGARQEALEQLKLLGVDVIRVMRKPLSGAALNKAQEKSPYGLTYGDAMAVRELLEYAPVVAAVRQAMAELKTEGLPVAVKVYGVSPSIRQVMKNELAAGRFLIENDDEALENVCVIGSAVKRHLFKFEDAVGKELELSGVRFTIVGVLAPMQLPEKMLVDIPDQNLDIYIPIRVSMRNFFLYSEQPVPTTWKAIDTVVRAMNARLAPEKNPVSAIVIKAGSEQAAARTAEIVGSMLRRRHNEVDDFQIDIPAELIRQSQETQRVFNIVMGAIAGISLLVGGIGIMNIMLATVTQRTREIGIRRCVGATRSDVVRQFLIEALVITVIGGLIGVGLGIGGAYAITHYAGWKTIVNTQAVALSLAVASAVGVIFGLYPAVRAASVDPITALRYE